MTALKIDLLKNDRFLSFDEDVKIKTDKLTKVWHQICCRFQAAEKSGSEGGQNLSPALIPPGAEFSHHVLYEE